MLKKIGIGIIALVTIVGLNSHVVEATIVHNTNILNNSWQRRDFDGVDERGKTGNDPTGNNDSVGSISCWFQFDTVLGANGVRWIFMMGGDDTDEATNFGQTGILLRRNSAVSVTNRLEIFHRVDGVGSTNLINGNTTIATGTLYHVVTTSSGTTYTMYLNGTTQTLTITSGSNNGDWFGDTGTNGTRHYAIADAWRDGVWAGNNMDGKIDNCATFSTELTSTEVTDLYNGGKPIHPCAVVNCSNVNVFYKLGEDDNGSATTSYASIGIPSTDNMTMDNQETADIVSTNYY